MSIDRCRECGTLVDTDNEPESYVQIGNMRNHEEYICLCRSHREERERDEPRQSRPMPDNIDALIAEELAADPRYNCDECDWDVDGCSPCPKHEDF